MNDEQINRAHGLITCPNCDGAGYVMCPVCWSYGWVTLSQETPGKWVPCNNMPHYRDYLKRPVKVCPQCGGNFPKRQCDLCKGTGNVYR